MLKKLGIALGVLGILVAGFVGYAATKPDSFRVERTAAISAPPAQIASYITDFRKWKAWSPWEKLDPAMKTVYSGAETGKGAIYEWSGNDQVGKGRMEILETGDTRIVIKLDFLVPFEANNVITFNLAPRVGSTDVAWVMEGPQPFMAKVMSVFMNMDAMIGKDFEAGLASLKAEAEKTAAKP